MNPTRSATVIATRHPKDLMRLGQRRDTPESGPRVPLEISIVPQNSRLGHEPDVVRDGDCDTPPEEPYAAWTAKR